MLLDSNLPESFTSNEHLCLRGEGGEVQIEQWNSQSNLYSCTIKIVDSEYELCLSDYYFIKI